MFLTCKSTSVNFCFCLAVHARVPLPHALTCCHVCSGVPCWLAPVHPRYLRPLHTISWNLLLPRIPNSLSRSLALALAFFLSLSLSSTSLPASERKESGGHFTRRLTSSVAHATRYGAVVCGFVALGAMIGFQLALNEETNSTVKWGKASWMCIGAALISILSSVLYFCNVRQAVLLMLECFALYPA